MRNPRLPKLTPRIGTSTSAAPAQSATESSVPSPPRTTSRSDVGRPAPACRRLCGRLPPASAPRSPSRTRPRARARPATIRWRRDAASLRAGATWRRCRRVSWRHRTSIHRPDDGRQRGVHRAGDADLAAERRDGAVHVIDLGRPAAHQVLAHRGDRARRAEDLGDGRQEIDVEGDALRCGRRRGTRRSRAASADPAAVGDPADFGAGDRRDRVDHAVEDQLSPDLGLDVGAKSRPSSPEAVSIAAMAALRGPSSSSV